MSDIRNSLKELIGDRIKRRRLALNIKQEELSTKLGIERVSMSNIESGRHMTDLSKLYELSVILNYDIHYLLPTYNELIEWEKAKHVDKFHALLHENNLDTESFSSIHSIIKNL